MLPNVDPHKNFSRAEWEKIMTERCDGKMMSLQLPGKEIMYGRMQRISVWFARNNPKDLIIIFMLQGDRLELSLAEFIKYVTDVSPTS